MELSIIEEKKNKLVVEIKGEDHTFANALKDELWNDKDVKVASYNISHPLVGVPHFVVETSSGSAKDAVVKAAQRVGKAADKFKSEITKAL